MGRGRLCQCAECHRETRNHGRGYCPSCYNRIFQKEYQRAWQRVNRAKKVDVRILCSECKESKRAFATGLCGACYARTYRKENPEKIAEHVRRSYVKHKPEKVLYQKKRRVDNWEAVRTIERASARNHRSTRNIYQRQWRQANPELMRAAKRRRAALMRHSPIRGFPRRLWLTLLEKYQHRCAYCGAANVKLTMDHITPLSKGGQTILENIVPACLSCNCKKHTKTGWVPRLPVMADVTRGARW